MNLKQYFDISKLKEYLNKSIDLIKIGLALWLKNISKKVYE